MTHPMQTPARELSPEEHRELVDAAYDRHNAIVADVKQGNEVAWALAEKLHDWDEEKRWRFLSSDMQSLGDWLAQPEIGMARSTYYRLVSLYHELVVVRQVDKADLAELPPAKVDITMAKIRDHSVPLDEALSDAKEMGTRDLREAYRKPLKERPNVGTPETTEEGQERVRNLNEVALGEVEDEPPFEDEEVVPAEQLAQNGDVPTSGQVVMDPDDVPVPRWLVEAIIGKFGINRRMNHEWIELLKERLEAANVG